jgi:hypothetical protein
LSGSFSVWYVLTAGFLSPFLPSNDSISITIRSFHASRRRAYSRRAVSG